MCIDDADPCVVWIEKEPVARKVHLCTECRLPIPVGSRHVRVDSLGEGGWERNRLHRGCMDLVKFIAKEMCVDSGYALGLLADEISGQDYSDDDHSERCGLPWHGSQQGPCAPDCLGMSTRETLTWLWDLVREPYRQGVTA